MSGAEQAWTALVDATPGGALWLYLIGSTLAQSGVALGVMGFFWLAERRGWLERYRYPDDKPPKPELLRQAWREALIAQLGTLPLFALLWPAYQWAGLRVGAPLPSPLEVLAHLALFLFVEDTLFYWGHRLFHQPWWFRKVHAKHHRFKGSRGPAYQFAHPLETLHNGVCLYLGTLLVPTHVITLWIWLAIRMFETVDAHSGYCLPLSPWSPRHAWHHRYVHGSFGSFFGLWDRIMGTDAGYREWVKAQAQE